jgi:hypothetical protein
MKWFNSNVLSLLLRVCLSVTLIGLSSSWSYARTLKELRALRDQKKSQIQKIKTDRENQAKSLRDQALAERDSALEKKQDLLRNVSANLTTSGQAKINQYQNELEAFQNNSRRVKIIRDRYLLALKQLRSKNSDLKLKIRDYASTELSKKELLRHSRANSTQEGLPPGLLMQRNQLIELYKVERAASIRFQSEIAELQAQIKNHHQTYLSSLEPYRGYLSHYQIPIIPLPELFLEELDRSSSYAKTRGNYFMAQTQSVLHAVENKIQDLVNQDIARKKDLASHKEAQAALSQGFVQTVNELIRRHAAILNQSYQLPGCGYFLEPLSHFYQEILSFKPLCSDLQALRNEKSAFYLGCQVLASTLFEAENFFNVLARDEMELTASLAVLESDSEILKQGDRLQTSLATAPSSEPKKIDRLIQQHDKLLNDWLALNREAL